MWGEGVGCRVGDVCCRGQGLRALSKTVSGAKRDTGASPHASPCSRRMLAATGCSSTVVAPVDTMWSTLNRAFESFHDSGLLVEG